MDWIIEKVDWIIKIEFFVHHYYIVHPFVNFTAIVLIFILVFFLLTKNTLIGK